MLEPRHDSKSLSRRYKPETEIHHRVYRKATNRQHRHLISVERKPMELFRSFILATLFIVWSVQPSVVKAFPSDWHRIRTLKCANHDRKRLNKCQGLPNRGPTIELSTGTRLHYASPAIMEVVQGSSLQVFPFSRSPDSRSLRIDMMTDGRPLEAQAALWQGPDYCPQKIRVYSENGYERPFRASIEAPRSTQFSVAVKNMGKTFEFPIAASVRDLFDMDEADANPFYYSELLLDSDDYDESNGYGNVLSRTNGRTIQGGAMRSFNFAPKVEKIQVLLQTSGMPLCARIEISQGPNNNKQVMDVYSEDGKRSPFYLAIDLPTSSTKSISSSSAEGSGHVMRIINAATMEYPIKVWVDSYKNGSTSRTQRYLSDADKSSRIIEMEQFLEESQFDSGNMAKVPVNRRKADGSNYYPNP